MGKDGRLFDCHKFRTMRVNNVNLNDNQNEKANTNGTNQTNSKSGWSTVSVAGDSRITPFGAKLRHYKLDELLGLVGCAAWEDEFRGAAA